MTNDSQDAIAALSQLSTDLADIIKGYKVIEERADDELLLFAQRLHALHGAHAAEILAALEDVGGDPEDTGSLMGAVHQAVATGRDWLGALDESALPQIVAGEERLVDTYDQTLLALDAYPNVKMTLRAQREAVQAQIDAINRS